MKNNQDREIPDQPIPDSRSEEFKKAVGEVEKDGRNTSQKQKEGVNFSSGQAEAIELITTLSKKLSRREIGGKIGYSKAYVISILKRRFWPKKQAKQQEILGKLQKVKIAETNNLNGD